MTLVINTYGDDVVMGLVDMEVEKVANEVTDMVADRMMDEMDEKS